MKTNLGTVIDQLSVVIAEKKSRTKKSWTKYTDILVGTNIFYDEIL
jgi:hypothetical protein